MSEWQPMGDLYYHRVGPGDGYIGTYCAAGCGHMFVYGEESYTTKPSVSGPPRFKVDGAACCPKCRTVSQRRMP